MSVTPRDFLDFAKRVVNGGEEIDFRNAASRAYYSVYLEAEVMTKRLNIPPVKRKVDDRKKKPGVHQLLIDAWTLYSGDPALQRGVRRIGGSMQQLKVWRVKADYRIDGSFPQATAQQAIRTAEMIRAQLSSLVPPTP